MAVQLTNHRGISLIELTIMLVVIGILTSVAMKTMTTAVEDARRIKTERELEMLAGAIVGDPSLTSSSRRADFGYVGDIGAFPPNLSALRTNPGFGTWDGPYLPLGYAQDTTGFGLDEWGSAYAYSGGVTISSSGNGTPIVKKIADSTADYLLNAYAGYIKDVFDSLPGNIKKDSVNIRVTIPNGSGGTVTKTYHPLNNGLFQLDSLPVGQHDLDIIYAPENDTLVRSITVLPRQQVSAPQIYKFAYDHFAGGGGGGCGSNIAVLRPNGAGSMTNLTRSGCGVNWQCVSEETADEDGSYVQRADNSFAPEVYAMENPFASPCAITKITVYCRARRTQLQGEIQPSIYVGGVEYNGTTQTLTTSYADYSAQWTTHPATGSAWTWTDINNLQAGLRIRGQNSSWPARCTQVWVEVSY